MREGQIQRATGNGIPEGRCLGAAAVPVHPCFAQNIIYELEEMIAEKEAGGFFMDTRMDGLCKRSLILHRDKPKLWPLF